MDLQEYILQVHTVEKYAEISQRAKEDFMPAAF